MESSPKEELIFNRNVDTKNLQSKDTNTPENEIVDLEIILLNPDPKTHDKFKNNDSPQDNDKSSSKTSPDLREFDPFAPEPKRTLVDENDKLFKDLSIKNIKSADLIEKSQTPNSNRSRRSRMKSPAADSNILEEMERRYREGKGESGSTIDFLDYF